MKVKRYLKFVSVLLIVANILVSANLSIDVYAESISYTNDLTDGLSASAFSASSVYGTTGYPSTRAFDNKWDESNGGWSSYSGKSTNEWIQVDFGTPKAISKLVYQADAYAIQINCSIKDFRIEASHDKNIWVTQYSGTALQDTTKQEFTWSPTSSFRYWRVFCLSSYGTNCIEISEMEMKEMLINPPSTVSTIPGNKQVTLNWNAVAGATNYNIKRATTSGGPYSTVASVSLGTTYIDTNVINGSTYYYIITASVNSAKESTNSIEAVGTPTGATDPDFPPPPPTIIQGNKAILEITMVNGIQKEYDMTAAEIEAFVKWYDDKESGIAGIKPYFSIKKNSNIKPFLNRWDYIVFSKIQDFEIKDYNDNSN